MTVACNDDVRTLNQLSSSTLRSSNGLLTIVVHLAGAALRCDDTEGKKLGRITQETTFICWSWE